MIFEKTCSVYYKNKFFQNANVDIWGVIDVPLLRNKACPSGGTRSTIDLHLCSNEFYQSDTLMTEKSMLEFPNGSLTSIGENKIIVPGCLPWQWGLTFQWFAHS